jgi:hypothetical protein
MIPDYEISLAMPDDAQGMLALQEVNLPDKGGSLSVRLTVDWFNDAILEKSAVVCRYDGKVVGYLRPAAPKQLVTRNSRWTPLRRLEINLSHGVAWKALISRYITVIPLIGDEPCIAMQSMSGWPLKKPVHSAMSDTAAPGTGLDVVTHDRRHRHVSHGRTRRDDPLGARSSH